ncbi:guanine deaminase [Friedmanniella luteola]|uniref:Guanine deaminase n=1 Tax=Friedmanniella luteola TaxID=546871 RepID=A0A1H2ACH8_9ACTN|nr:amidohydrolase family protein [Friedmanniella luteola]SDT43648.1 guanine deaminase [Friedmanniella luteola]
MRPAAGPEPTPAGARLVVRGHVFHVAGDATLATAREQLVSLPDGALVIAADGTIAWLGDHADLPAEHARTPVRRADFVLPGFVDTHLHYPQTATVDAHGGGQLLHWLQHCIFPAEARLADPEVATALATAFVRQRVAAGTTAALVFGSAFPAAQDALFAAHQEAGLRLVSGRGIQTVGSAAAAPLLTGEDEALALVAEEIERWHLADTGDPATARLQVAVVPRFSLSVTPTTLAGLGELYAGVRERGVYFHSHLSENDTPGVGEVAAVRAAYGVRDYLDTYDGRFRPGSAVGGESLLGRRSILAHAVHCTDAELARLAETGSSVAHCPTSQQFLGSGTMPWRRTTAAGVRVALGTDIGAGDEWLVSRVLNDAYKVHLSEPGDAAVALHPAELLYTGTLAGAQALDSDARFGNLDAGKEADLVLVDASGWPPLATILEGVARTTDERSAADSTLFALLMGLREPAVSGVFVGGHEISSGPVR